MPATALASTRPRTRTRGAIMLVLGLALGLPAAPGARATDLTWINDVGGDFEDPGNWDPFGPPGPLDTMIFDLDTNYGILFSSSPSVAGLILAEGDLELDFDFEIVVAGEVVVGETALDTAILTLNDGTLRVPFSVLPRTVRVGKDAGANGTIVIPDGCDLDAGVVVLVGDGGHGSVEVTAGGVFLAKRTTLGDDPGATGSVSLSGPLAQWTDSDGPIVGNAGNGTVSIASGATATWNGLSRLADDAGTTGDVTITGAGSSVTAAGELFVGNLGTGTIDVAAGGQLTTTRVKIGDETGSTGSMSVTGPGSVWNDGDDVFVGNFGQGSLTVSGGGVVSGARGTIGDDPGSVGTATISGAGSNWTLSESLLVGHLGAGTLHLTGGGTVNAPAVSIGDTGTLKIGLATGISDVPLVTGTATLGGTLDVSFVAGSEPADEAFVILTATSIAGTFATESLPPDVVVEYGATEVTVIVGDPSTGPLGDLDGDGTVGFGDLLIVLSTWGPCPPPPDECPVDLDGSGDVGFGDLLLVLSNWGAGG